MVRAILSNRRSMFSRPNLLLNCCVTAGAATLAMKVQSSGECSHQVTNRGAFLCDFI